MRLLLDENMSDRRLAARLRAQGYDPVLATDVGQSSGDTILNFSELGMVSPELCKQLIAKARSALNQEAQEARLGDPAREMDKTEPVIFRFRSRSGEDLGEFLVGPHQVVDRSPRRVRPFLLYRVPLRIPSIALRIPWAMFLNASSLFVHVVTGRRSIGSPWSRANGAPSQSTGRSRTGITVASPL